MSSRSDPRGERSGDGPQGPDHAAARPGPLIEPVPHRLPIDVLHISDLHFCRWYRSRDRTEKRWTAFLAEISDIVRRGDFHPEIIAFTGDLIDTPGPKARVAFRRGVAALLELAYRCGIAPRPSEIKLDGHELPKEWGEVLYRRVFIVPGNHDVYFKGLRGMWNRDTHHWLEIAAPTTEHRARLGERLVPRDARAGPLAIRMLDSNGKRAFWESARGEVEQPVDLEWSGDAAELADLFGVALVHGHPIQLPYLLEGLTERETSMLMENAGLLLKNLVAADIRLVLHGHRHYPGVGTLVVPHPEGTGRPIVVVGAGSITRPPSRLGDSSFNWIRIHPDFRVEVHDMRRRIGETCFLPARPEPFLADQGDFRYDRTEKQIEIKEPTGDAEVTIRIAGFRVTPGRAPIRAIPLSLQLRELTRLAAFEENVVVSGGEPGTQVEWNVDRGYLEFNPPHRPESPPLELEIRYFLHNAMALTDWELIQMFGDGEWFDSTSLQSSCLSGSLRLKVTFPASLFAHVSSSQHHWMKRSRPMDHSGVSNSAVVRSAAGTRQLEFQVEAPSSTFSYELCWGLPTVDTVPLGIRKTLVLIREWQAYLVNCHHSGQTPLDDACRKIVEHLGEQGLLTGVEVSLFIGDISDLRRTTQGASTLRLVGSSVSLPKPVTDYVLPFGAGVAGRSFRMGKVILYDKLEAETTEGDYRVGKRGTVPTNFLHPLGRGEVFSAVLAAPVLSRELPPDSRYTLAILCIATRDPQSPLLSWRESDLELLTLQVLQPLEREIYQWASELAEQRGPTEGDQAGESPKSHLDGGAPPEV